MKSIKGMLRHKDSDEIKIIKEWETLYDLLKTMGA